MSLSFSIFRPYEGHIEDSTEMRNQYQDHGGHLDQALKTREVLRPSSNIKLASEGDRIWNTGRNDYAPFGPSSEKPIKAKGQNTNLKPYTGKLDSLTEHRDRFIPKELENRANKIRPTTTIIREGTVGQKIKKFQTKKLVKSNKSKKIKNSVKLLFWQV